MTLQISQRVLDLGEKARQGLAEQFARIDAIAEENTARVLSAFQKHRVAEGYFAGTTGYGYDDLGRDQLDQIYADLFGTEAALVRIQFVNGTHAITCALFGALKAGDVLLSGSFVVSGECYARLEKVGNESYISKLSMEAKTMGSGEQSEMIRSINLIVKWVGIIIIPIGIILFWQSHFVNDDSIRKSVTSTVAAILGMIPEGLYLLTTIALALSTMNLAIRKVLLHDMKSIETLARVDVLCVDKTGTITEPVMSIKDVFLSKDSRNPLKTIDELKGLLIDYTAASQDNNATMEALKKYADEADGSVGKHRVPLDRLAFSSSLKYGSITFSDGIYLLGAPEFIMRDDYASIEKEILPYAEKGDRVLLFGRYEGSSIANGLSDRVTPLGFVALANPIRENAVKTLAYFKSQDVAIKVISGDNPKTVSQIAVQAGIDYAESYVDATTLDTDTKIKKAVREYTVFGRVTP